jgi:16S rRNA (guanine527-N7)-methyltransferase
VFPHERLSLVERYVGWLAGAGTERGLMGPREVPRLWERHVLNSAVLGEWVPEGVSVADIGSGAGLPGLVLALARPDLQVTLVEPLLRRATFLQEVVDDLGVDVEVVRARAEELHGRRTFDVVTSRAVAPLDRLAGWCMPLVGTGGAMIALKGSSVEAEVSEHRASLLAHGTAEPQVRPLGADVLESPTWAVRLAWAGDPQVSWRLPRGARASSGPRSTRRRPAAPARGRKKGTR